jgi:hypothetical protein
MQFLFQDTGYTLVPKHSVHFVVPCSHRKRRDISDGLRLRSFARTPQSRLLRSWVRALEAAPVSSVPATDLYGGEHWQVALDLPRQAAMAGVGADLWVLSAGYGLLSAEQHLKPYSATFTPGHPDSATRSSHDARSAELQEWWTGLTVANPLRAEQSSLAALADSDPTSSIIVAASRYYLEACELDLLLAASRLANPDQLIILSTSLSQTSALWEYAIPIDARLQHVVGGTRVALNTRAAAVAVSAINGEGPLRSTAAPLMKRLLDSQPPPRRFDRRQLADTEVKAWIEAELALKPGTSRTRLLQILRSRGMACEQQRFGRLYGEVRTNG